MNMPTDPLTAAKTILEQRYLERSMVTNPEGAAKFAAEGLTSTFTRGRAFCTLSERPAVNAKRYAPEKKQFLRSDTAPDPNSVDVHVYNTGYLCGEWKDGSTFDTNRYIDIFVVSHDEITSTQDRYDRAEILLDKAGRAEAPL